MEACGFNVDSAGGDPEAGAQRKLRLLLDARKIDDGGIGVYIRNLVSGLLAVGGVDMTLITRGVSSALNEWRDRLEVIFDAAPSYSFDELFRLARRIDTRRFDVFHAPHYMLPFGLRLPTVVTIHDLIHIQHPERRYYPLVARSLIRSALKRATRVLTVSRASFQGLSHLAMHRENVARKLRVVPNAIDPYFMELASSAGHVSEYLSSRLHLKGRFILSVFSMAKPHKGIRDLLLAFDSACKQHAKSSLAPGDSSQGLGDLKLVMVGKGTEGMVDESGLLEAAGANKRVVLLGSVSREALGYLYAGASALVIASTAEGFCLPMLEARVFNTPVILRPIPVLLELAGAKDIVCRDMSLLALQEGLVSFLQRRHDVVPHFMNASARTDLSGYLVDEVARRVLEVYREAVREYRQER